MVQTRKRSFALHPDEVAVVENLGVHHQIVSDLDIQGHHAPIS
jgi:hypothetical protein